MGLFDIISEIIKKIVYEKNDVSAECEDSIQFADNGVINIDNSYVVVYNY